MGGLALTFDDGPDARWTPILLDVLAAHGVPASFFLIGPRAATQPMIVERMLLAGHCVGLHCDVHRRHSTEDRYWLEADTERALMRLRALGVVPTLWRTPWGDIAPWTTDVAKRHQLRLVGWTVDTHDWGGDSAETIFEATRPELRAGAIVLAHDGIGPGARRADPRETIAFVEIVIRYAAERHLELSALR